MDFIKTSVSLLLGLASLLANSALFAATIVDLHDQEDAILNQFVIQTNPYTNTNPLLVESPNTLVELSLIKDQQGILHGRYQQYHRGIPVWGNQIVTHQSTTSESAEELVLAPKRLDGTLAMEIEKDISINALEKKRDPAKILSRVKEQFLHRQHTLFPESSWSISKEATELVYFVDENNKAHLAYVINFLADSIEENHPSHPFYIIDIANGKILQEWDGITYAKVATGPGGNLKTGLYTYGTHFDFLDITITAVPNCALENNKVRTIHFRHATDITCPGKTHHFICYDQKGDEINGAYSPLNDAHYFGGVVFDMYQDWFGIPPLKQKIVLCTHYGNNYENAFWHAGIVAFGDGNNSFYPLTSLDVIAHEISHGFTAQNSRLPNFGQAGSINEAFSDMAAKAVEYYLRGSNTWIVAADVTKKREGLRYMDNPPKDGHSIADARTYGNSNYEVHYGCGVFNKAFYLIAGSEGWNTRKAFEIMVQANRFYWVASSTLLTAARAVVETTQELGYDTATVISAFYNVGIQCTATPAGCQLRTD